MLTPLRRALVAALGVLPVTLAAPAGAVPGTWSALAAPTPGPPRVIGGYGAACITGAVPLPPEGVGYQAADLSRGRTFGHPDLLAFIATLGGQVAAARLGTMLVGDLAQPRGGPMSSGHVSHQGGLDVDIWFRLDVTARPAAAREGIPEPSMVDAATGRPDPARWSDRQAELIHLAALDGRVSRVFVGAAIKRDLCERQWADRSWLRQVRPWPGHDDHLHVRLRCPADSPACRAQPELPAGEGCGQTELAASMARERAQRGRPAPVPRGVLPAVCAVVLEGHAPGAAVTTMKGDGKGEQQRVGGGADHGVGGGRSERRGGEPADGTIAQADRSAAGRHTRRADQAAGPDHGHRLPEGVPQ
jgi:penicillin-insensitive murein endopeptidase